MAKQQSPARKPAKRAAAEDEPGETPAGKPRPQLDIAGVDPLAAVPTRAERGAFLGMLLRFISCGILALIAGLAWRLTLAPARVGVGTSLLGILILLAGFVVGGILWYIRDVRLRSRHPERITDERLVFSFIVFAVVPFLVAVLVGLIWLLAFFIGA